ncbi:PTPLA-domain-containing protein [Xylariaceae sp. AK1471]|nr:PTPLA-domain-containing protein [Xylariaceae sp. AK1471]
MPLIKTPHYLLLYNLFSLIAWTYLTTRAVLHISTNNISPHTLLSGLLPYVTVTQTFATLEVLHAALGLVRASPATTALQVGGRNLVVWTVMRQFPDLLFASDGHGNGNSRGYGRYGVLGCVLAWGCSDVLRYAFFVAQLVSKAPDWLKWLRYSAFVVLYPVGFLSEASLVYIGLVGAGGIGPFYRGYLFLGLLAYIPASYILYTYMISQRRRALKRPEKA